MSDYAHEWTDEQIEQLTVSMHEVYAQAANEMQDNLEEWTRDYQRQLKEWRKAVKAGTRTQKEFDAWLKKKSIERTWQQDMINTLSMDAVNADIRCRQLINNELPSVLAENANYAAYDIDSLIGYDTMFTLYDQDTVRNLILNEPQLLPSIDVAKDYVWNQQKFASAITQGILQGESIPKMAMRLNSVFKMGERASVMAARTACTSAENAGRVNSYKRAKSMGIKLRQEWLATLDSRTRHSHRLLDGQKADVGGVFHAEGGDLRFPGDPQGPASEVYNCRCRLVAAVEGIDQSGAERWSRLPDGMTYEEWKTAKEPKNAD